MSIKSLKYSKQILIILTLQILSESLVNAKKFTKGDFGNECIKSLYKVPDLSDCNKHYICSGEYEAIAVGSCDAGFQFDSLYGTCRRTDLVGCQPMHKVSSRKGAEEAPYGNKNDGDKHNDKDKDWSKRYNGAKFDATAAVVKPDKSYTSQNTGEKNSFVPQNDKHVDGADGNNYYHYAKNDKRDNKQPKAPRNVYHDYDDYDDKDDNDKSKENDDNDDRVKNWFRSFG